MNGEKKEFEVTPKQCHEIGLKLAREMWGDNYQIIVATHLDRGHLHNHFCFNSVSYLDGKKYNYSKSEQKRLREVSDRLCREYGLSVIENSKKAPSRPLYLDEKSGKPTRYNVYLEDLTEAISGSRDIPHMMKYLTDKVYEVDFSGSHWKMKLPQYKHFTRLDTLDECLTPDFIRSHLGTRARYGNYKARISYSPYMPEECKNAWKPRQKTTGILALYYYWCYQLGIFPKGTDYKPTSPLMKEELRKLDEITAQVWNKVQMIRANKRRPTKNGATSIFTGLLYCADCGTKLSLRAAKNYLYFRCSKYKGNSRSGICTQHYIREDVLYQLVLKQLQHFLSYLQQFERVFIKRQIDNTLAERRYELSAKQKQIEKDEKRMKELDRLFRKIYEDNVNGKLNDERFYKLSDGYEAEQEQLRQEIETLTVEVSETDTEITNVSKLIAATKKYTRIDELTPEILNTFVDKIVVHECEKKDGKRTQDIDIYYSYVGIVDIPTDEEMREMEREYGQSTKRQTA